MEESRFVGREAELARLQSFLERALAGHAQVALVAGEAGSGKTALLREFGARAQQAESTLVVASGNCNAQTGLGDPYLPFRDVLRLLTGDVEDALAANLVNAENGNRLRALLGRSAQVLLEVSPDLTGILLAGIPGAALAARGAAFLAKKAGVSERLDKWIKRPAAQAAAEAELDPQHILEQYGAALRALAEQAPLVLALDDLQWADAASVSLFFHLARQLDTARVLLLGAYRPDEVALGRGGQPHPLAKVLAEIKRYEGDITLDLAQRADVDGQRFVDALLDEEPNVLDAAFRRALYQRTEGHPLFTIELLRDLQERGDLQRDDQGRWTVAPTFSWEALPARVEGVLEERIARLEPALRELLCAAAVEGNEFTVQVLATVQNVPERQLLQQLTRELDQRHHLVRELPEIKLGRQAISRYAFSHALFQQYLYAQLGAGERRLLHGDVARRLEELYAGHTDDIAVQLARHYWEAGDGEKAVPYLLKAGDKARALYASAEAVEHYQRALELLQEQGDYSRAARTWMKLGLTYHIAFDFASARQAYEQGFALWQLASEADASAVLPPAPHPLRLYWGEPNTLDPTLAGDTDSLGVVDQLFCGLVERSPEMDIMPELAQSWELLEGGRRYVFHLRADACWTDGTPVTASDLEYAWKRALRPDLESPGASMLFDVQGARAFHSGETRDADAVQVQALNPTTLVVTLEGPTSYFLHLLTHPALYPLPRHVLEAHGAAWTQPEHIVTNGPFRLQEWQKGQHMWLVRNPDYRGRFTGNLERVELAFGREPQARVAMYEAGQLDVLVRFATSALEQQRLRMRHADEYLSGPLLTTGFVRFDVTRPPFDDVRVRQAFVLATDRERVTDSASRGFAFPAQGGFVPLGMPGYSPGVALPCDPDRARQLLAEAGFPGGRGFPRVQALTHPGSAAMAQQLTQEWQAQLGVQVNWQPATIAQLLDATAKEGSQLMFDGWLADYPDPDNCLRVGLQFLLPAWKNEEFEGLVEQARRSPDQAERMRLYRQAECILAQEVPLMPVFYSRFHLLVKPWVKRYPTSALRHWFWKDAVIEDG